MLRTVLACEFAVMLLLCVVAGSVPVIACPKECGDLRVLPETPCTDLWYGGSFKIESYASYAICDGPNPGPCTESLRWVRTGTTIAGTGPCVNGYPSGTITESSVCYSAACKGMNDGSCPP